MATVNVDLDSQRFEIGREFLEKYPESVFAKSLEVVDERDDRYVEIDRSGKYLTKILEYCRGNKEAIKLSQMSHYEVKKLLNDAKFFGFEELLEKCERELQETRQTRIETATDEKKLKEMLAGETRLVIVLNVEYFLSKSKNQKIIEKALHLVDRNRCLIVGCMGKRKDLSYFHDEGLVRLYQYDSYLYDPVNDKILNDVEYTGEDDLLQMVLYANTPNAYMMTKIFNEHEDAYDEFTNVFGVSQPEKKTLFGRE